MSMVLVWRVRSNMPMRASWKPCGALLDLRIACAYLVGDVLSRTEVLHSAESTTDGREAVLQLESLARAAANSPSSVGMQLSAYLYHQ